MPGLDPATHAVVQPTALEAAEKRQDQPTCRADKPLRHPPITARTSTARGSRETRPALPITFEWAQSQLKLLPAQRCSRYVHVNSHLVSRFEQIMRLL
jgi:hypothetical protein